MLHRTELQIVRLMMIMMTTTMLQAGSLLLLSGCIQGILRGSHRNVTRLNAYTCECVQEGVSSDRRLTNVRLDEQTANELPVVASLNHIAEDNRTMRRIDEDLVAARNLVVKQTILGFVLLRHLKSQ
jgi:hypothetical protein